MSQNQKIRVRKNFEPSEDEGISFTEASLTKQSFKDECDINLILAKYASTGLLPEMIKADPRYGDFSSVPDYQNALNIVAQAHEQFASLDAHIRDRFHNDPERFLTFTSNPENGPEMVRLGLAVIRPSQNPEPKGSSISKKSNTGQSSASNKTPPADA